LGATESIAARYTRATRESYLTRFPFLVNHAKGERKFQFPDSEERSPRELYVF